MEGYELGGHLWYMEKVILRSPNDSDELEDVEDMREEERKDTAILEGSDEVSV